MMYSKIIVFTRYPRPGKTKTRLIPLLGGKGAATLQRKLTERVVTVVKHFSESCNVPIEIRYHGGSAVLMSRWLGNDLVYRRQEGVGLGRKMHRAFQEAFEDGCAGVILVGADVLGISVPILEASLDLLASHDLVLGPANDGGYYLLGLREPRPEIFENISWGSSDVLTETVERAGKLGLDVGFVQALDDVDRPEDFLKLNLHGWFTQLERRGHQF
jgi:uncharacterized protein